MRLQVIVYGKRQYISPRFSNLIFGLFFFLILPTVHAFGSDVDKVMAIVNGFKIFNSDVEKARQQLPKEAEKYPKAVVDRLLLDNLLNTRLVAEAARKEGLHKNESVVRKLLRAEDQVLNAIYLDHKIKKYVTDEKIRIRYRSYLKSTAAAEEIRARHILVQTREQALEVINRLEGGESFKTLAKSVSTGPSGKEGGDLGYFSRDQMVARFSIAAFSIPVGEFTRRPVKTQFGWHVIKVEDKRNLKPKEFDQIKEFLREKIAGEYEESVIKDLRRAADIKMFLIKGNKAGDQSLMGVKRKNK